MVCRRALLLLSALLLLPGRLTAQDDASPEAIEFFEKKVRPLLVDQCYSCHSADAKKVKGKLLLDSREAAIKGGETGPAVVAKHPEKSLLIEAIEYKNVDLLMPPRAKLSDAQIADLRKWVAMGAPWPKTIVAKKEAKKDEFDLEARRKSHWCWQALAETKLPDVKNEAWAKTPIDRYILAKLEAKGLKPAPAADRRTWIRRVSFDIVGLPPTAQEIEAFEQDKGDDAHAKVVDRLLASPQFGERWARHWLDLVRYAESRGHEFDYTIPNAYQYRDYVIRALNADVPYDRFATEHLAGDLMPTVRKHPQQGFNESILGTGFWFLGEQVHSPVDITQDKADRFDNMVDVMSKTFLGLTVSCARCHDHKFDAISARDYYSLASFIESSSYRLVPFESLEHNRGVAERLWKARAEAKPQVLKALADLVRTDAERVPQYLKAARESLKTGKDDPNLDFKKLTTWKQILTVASKDATSPLHILAAAPDDWAGYIASLTKQPEASKAEIIVDYANPGRSGFEPDGFGFGPDALKPGDLRWSTDQTQPLRGIADRGIADFDATWSKPKASPGSENEPTPLGRMVRSGRTLRTPSFEVKNGLVHVLVRGQAMVYVGMEKHVQIAGPLHGALVQAFNVGLEWKWHTINLTPYKGRRAHFEITPEIGECSIAMVAQGEGPLPAAKPIVVPESFAKTKTWNDAADGVAKALLSNDATWANWAYRHRAVLGDATKLDEVVREAFAEQTKIASDIRHDSRLAPAMLDGDQANLRVYLRGSYKTMGDETPRRHLEAFAGSQPISAERGSGRLELARQIVDPKLTPLFPRVIVNRIWHHLFGRGIVGSVDDFGYLGERPTHPELLDHLASDFVANGWSLKKAIRTMVLSNTYRMSVQPDAKAMETDPGNLLLHHMRVRRLEGEAIRDAMLTVSGRLDRMMYGPSIPVHLTTFQDGRGRPGSGPIDGNGRRSVYLSVRRNFLSPFLLAFDTPIPFSAVGRRSVSNVPAQALILLNDPFVHQQAEIWAKKTLAQGKTDEERIASMHLAAFGRQPSAEETAACLEYVRQRPANSPEAAAWASLAHVLFNAKEFIFLQ
ncbi:MAG: PSD1 and planctomycete cytochrome C domain-containing protein [Gemmataceae bacterium]